MSIQTIDKSSLAERVISTFDTVSKQNAVVTAVRLEALTRFETLGFPSIKNEEWKYTNLKPVVNQDFVPNAVGNISAEQLQDSIIPTEKASILVFVNGAYQPALSVLTQEAEGIVVTTFKEALSKYPEIVEAHFAKYADFQKDALTAMNTAFAEDGVFAYVPDKKVLEAPVYVYFISDSQQVAPLSQLRNLIVAGRSSQAKFVTAFHTIGELHSFTNVVTEIVVGENASVEHYILQNEAEQAYIVGTTQAQLARDCHFTSHTVSLNGALIRNNLNMVLAGSNIDAHMYGLYLLNGNCHVDNHTLADHQQPNSFSNELYKGILDGKSTGVFNGKIYVKPDAQKTNAFQSNRNLVLSKDAAMNTKPQLEIFADDVKCSHGATVGQLDDEMLFYLRSRGIGFESARALLMRAFADDVLQNMTLEEVHTHVDRWIADRFL
ncbi:Fe-S cluster assembly protein SufD [Cytophagaceae bacterium YF14B1]|uniref:Fe-S cluster assembly protein SufD n=1 Tax=Xanthocytophaga flava TaxID=3048013 RepID=A0AAE3QRT1_9BACT|nr:Fe-S cluster assembly protein SufD [Xanthocytophaga flavus]MDJ1484287.1 Fe-S cluster assembly protein SufD [Xanthocytophaga flavus]